MRIKGMIDRRALGEIGTLMAGVEAGIVSAFPPTFFPMDFPTPEGMYSIGPVPLTGGGFSSTESLMEIPDGATYVSENFRNAWDVGWLADLVLGLEGWANGGQTEMTNHWPDFAGIFEPFGSGNAAFNRRRWGAGSVAENFAASYDQSAFLAVSDTTAGRLPMGVAFPDWGFTETNVMTLEDSNDYPVTTWIAGDLTPFDGFSGDTEWEIKAKVAKARADAVLALFTATAGPMATIRERFRLWSSHGSQTDGRGL